MCGRYASSRKPEDLVEEFEIPRSQERQDRVLPPGKEFNLAPTDPVWVVLERPPRGEPESPPVRRLALVRWGLVPSWADSPKVGNRMINARSETAATKPAFRRAFAGRRCLLPADGWFEWYAQADGRKQPFFLRPPDGGVLAMAGIYEFWRDKNLPDDAPGAWLTTVAVLTRTATDTLGQVHDRMPVLVLPADRQGWLDSGREDASALLAVRPPHIEAFPVSSAVNGSRAAGAALVEPLPLEAPEVLF